MLVGPRNPLKDTSLQGTKILDEPTLLKVVRPLIKFVRGLPDYVGRTEKIGPVAKAVFGVLKEARKPDQLLFTDLPTACGAPPFKVRGSTRPDQVDAFFGTLRVALAAPKEESPPPGRAPAPRPALAAAPVPAVAAAPADDGARRGGPTYAAADAIAYVVAPAAAPRPLNRRARRAEAARLRHAGR